MCPACTRDLVGRQLPRLGFHVSACPEGHGAWKRLTIEGLERVALLGAFAVVAALALGYAVVSGGR